MTNEAKDLIVRAVTRGLEAALEVLWNAEKDGNPVVVRRESAPGTMGTGNVGLRVVQVPEPVAEPQGRAGPPDDLTTDLLGGGRLGFRMVTMDDVRTMRREYTGHTGEPDERIRHAMVATGFGIATVLEVLSGRHPLTKAMGPVHGAPQGGVRKAKRYATVEDAINMRAEWRKLVRPNSADLVRTAVRYDVSETTALGILRGTAGPAARGAHRKGK